MIFRPKPSFGWAWSFLLAAILLVAAVAPLLDRALPVTVVGLILSAFIGAIGIWVWLIGIMHWQMLYEFADDALHLRLGFLLTYRIPYDEIDGVEQRDLRPTLWSSMRWPGLAVYKVPYGGDGQIRMMSTRMARDVVVIRADGNLYGMSPAEEDRFLAELRSRAKRLR